MIKDFTGLNCCTINSDYRMLSAKITCNTNLDRLRFVKQKNHVIDSKILTITGDKYHKKKIIKRWKKFQLKKLNQTLTTILMNAAEEVAERKKKNANSEMTPQEISKNRDNY